MSRFWRRTASSLLLNLTVAVAWPSAAHAQMAVFDGAAYQQLISQEVSLASQLTALQNQLQTQLDMIKSTQSNVFSPISGLANATVDLENSIYGIKDFGQSLQSQIDSAYPMQFPSGSPQQILDTIAAETQNTRQAIEVSQSLQNQVAANQSQIWAAVQRANAASQSAPGQLAAQQQTNQILTAEIQQLGDLQAILISDERAQQATKLEDQSREEGAAQLNSTQGITFNSNQQGF